MYSDSLLWRAAIIYGELSDTLAGRHEPLAHHDLAEEREERGGRGGGKGGTEGGRGERAERRGRGGGGVSVQSPGKGV